MCFGEAYQVQFVLLAFAQAPLRIAVGPKFALCDVLKGSNSRTDAQNLGLDGPSQERLISFVGGELNPKFASRRLSIQRVRIFFDFEALLPEMRGKLGETRGNDHDIGVKRIYGINVTVHGQTANQAVGAER